MDLQRWPAALAPSLPAQVLGSEGALFYGGDDSQPGSGRLELRRRDSGGRAEVGQYSGEGAGGALSATLR